MGLPSTSSVPSTKPPAAEAPGDFAVPVYAARDAGCATSTAPPPLPPTAARRAAGAAHTSAAAPAIVHSNAAAERATDPSLLQQSRRARPCIQAAMTRRWTVLHRFCRVLSALRTCRVLFALRVATRFERVRNRALLAGSASIIIRPELPSRAARQHAGAIVFRLPCWPCAEASRASGCVGAGHARSSGGSAPVFELARPRRAGRRRHLETHECSCDGNFRTQRRRRAQGRLAVPKGEAV
jgi:hypothetical protein